MTNAITFVDYLKYVRFTCDEELERLSEFLYGVNNLVDQSEDKYYVQYPNGCVPPDYEDAVKLLASRDKSADFAIIDGDDEDQRESLYEELREILLYSSSN